MGGLTFSHEKRMKRIGQILLDIILVIPAMIAIAVILVASLFEKEADDPYE